MSLERKVEILPGFSKKNEEWAAAIKNGLQEHGNFQATVVSWPHWETGSANEGWIENEANKIAERVGEDTINIIAKSVGTMVAMEVVRQSVHVDKMILCGIPIEDFQEDSKDRYSVLKNVDANRILVFQNDKDPHGKLDDVRSLVHEFNPDITIKTKMGNHHEYLYTDDFIDFLSQD